MDGIAQLGLANLAKSKFARGLADTNAAGSSGNLFQNLLQTANNNQLNADNVIRDFIQQKEGTNVQQVVMALAEAEMSFQFFMEVRNQLIDSYTELTRMQF